MLKLIQGVPTSIQYQQHLHGGIFSLIVSLFKKQRDCPVALHTVRSVVCGVGHSDELLAETIAALPQCLEVDAADSRLWATGRLFDELAIPISNNSNSDNSNSNNSNSNNSNSGQQVDIDFDFSSNSTSSVFGTSSTFSQSTSSYTESSRSSSNHSSNSSGPCCDNPEKYHVFTYSPSERSEIIDFVNNGTYPSRFKNSRQKQGFRTKWQAFSTKTVSSNGDTKNIILKTKTTHYYKHNNKKVNKNLFSGKQGVTPPDEDSYYTEIESVQIPECNELKQIFLEYHRKNCSGQRKMHNALKSKYKFKNATEFVKHGISQCLTCDGLTKSNKTILPRLKPTPIPIQPMTVVHIDAAGPFPESTKGNRYFLIAVCRLTGYPEVEAVPNKKASTIAKFILYNLFARYGYLHIYVSDNGGEFENKLCNEILGIMRTKHIKITPYHPQGNGKAEANVKKMKKALKVCIAKERGDFQPRSDDEQMEDVDDELEDDSSLFEWGDRWDEWVFEEAKMSLRFEPLGATKHSPLTHLTMKEPIQIASEIAVHTVDADFRDAKFMTLKTATFNERLKHAKEFLARVKTSWRLAQTAMVKQWDTKRGAKCILKEGDMVKYKDCKVSKCKSGMIKWLPSKGYGIITHISRNDNCDIQLFNHHGIAGSIVENLKMWNMKRVEKKHESVLGKRKFNDVLGYEDNECLN